MFRKWSIILMCGTAFPGIVTQAVAQEAPAANASIDTSEIVVQARRRDELLRTVPVAITALPAQELERRQIVTTQDLTFVTPGLVVAPALSRDQPAFVIRGQQRLISGDGAPAVLTYFADVPLPNDGSIMPTYDIQSIQVLKGPQGTLFGRNTTGGAVLVYPVAPTFEFGGFLRGTYGKYNERTVEGAINLPLGSAIALRVAGQLARRDGYTKNLLGGRDLDDRHTDAVRASLVIEPSSTFKNTTIVDYYAAREAGTGIILESAYPAGGVAGGGIARIPHPLVIAAYDCGRSVSCDIDLQVARQQAAGKRAVYTNLTPYSNRTLWGITNTSTLDLGSVSLKNIFGYRNTDIEFSRDYDGSTLTGIEQTGETSPEQFSNELQAYGNALGDRLDWIVGAFYYKSRDGGLSGTLATTWPSPVLGTAPTYFQKYNDITSKAVFGQVGLEVVKHLKINAGFRYTWDKTSNCGLTIPASLGTPGRSPQECRTRGGNIASVRSSAPTWTLGLEFKASDNVFLYATTRRGYRAGGVNRSGLNAAWAAEGLESYRPEKVTDVELGAKTVWRSGGMSGSFNIAGYRSTYKDIQTIAAPRGNADGDNNPLNDPFSLIYNPGSARIQGVEIDATLAPTAGIELSGFVNYTDAKYTAFEAPSVFVNRPDPLVAFDTATGAFPYTPKWSGGGSANFYRELPENIGRLNLSITHYRSGPVTFSLTRGDPFGTERAYSTTNLRIYLDKIGGRDLGVGFYVRNLLDTTYAAAAGFAAAPLTASSRVYNEPRIFGIEARVGFGG